MYKKLLCVITALLTLSLFFAGCEDDDCPSCPNADQTSVMFGEVDIDGGDIEFYGMIFGITGTLPDIDSVRVDGNIAEMEEYIGEGVGCYVYYESSDGTHESGEIIYIEIFAPEGKSECSIKALDDDDDEPVMIMDYAVDWPYDTVAVGDDIEFDWNPVLNADYYVVNYYHRWGSGDTGRGDFYEFTTDTSFAIPSSENQYDGYFYFSVVAITGPNPAFDEGNITGGIVKGMINSYSAESFDLYVGDGDPYDGPPKMSPAVDEHQTVKEIMNKIRGL